MSNENKGQAPAEELMDFLAAGKEARRVGGDSAARDRHFENERGEEEASEAVPAEPAAETDSDLRVDPDEIAALRAALIGGNAPEDDSRSELAAALLAMTRTDEDASGDEALFARLDAQSGMTVKQEEEDNRPRIRLHPQSVSVPDGEEAVMHVEADGEALTYCWQYQPVGKTKWFNSHMPGAETDTLRVKAAKGRSGQKYRCVVKNPVGSAESDFAKLSVLPADPGAEKEKAPQEETPAAAPAAAAAASAEKAEEAAFEAEAAESGPKKRWQRRARRKADEEEDWADDDDDDDDWDDDDEDDEDDEPVDPRVRRRRRRGLAIGAIAAILCLALFGGAMAVSRLQTVYPKLTVQDVEVGGMTVEQAAEAVRDAGWDGGKATVLKVTLPGSEELDITSGLTGWTASAEECAQAAWDYGRGGNLISNLFKYLHAAISGHDLTEELMGEADTAALRKLIDDGVEKANETLGDGSMELDTKAKLLRLVKGGDLLAVESDDVYMQVLEALEDHQSELNCVRKLDKNDSSKDVDMQKLHDEICGEPENASYDAAKKEVVEGKPGVEFNVKEAEKLWKQAEVGDTVEIPLEVTEPTFMKADFKGLFSDKLASKTTSLSGSSANRVNNITLAAQKINGVILNPGDTFSYNTTVGQRTTAAGFREAGAYANGEVVSEVGGGICQVSSTLYHCAMTSNLKITARTNHYFSVGYIEPDMDATVSWGNPDFKFQNDRTFPVKIVAYVKNGSVTVEIWGTDVDGTTVKMDYTSNGLTTTTYRNVYDKDGKLLSRTQEAVSTYHTHENTAPANTTRPTYTTRPVVTAAPPAPTATPVEPTSAPTAAPTAEPTQTPTAPPEETEPPIQTSAPPEEMPPEDPGE